MQQVVDLLIRGFREIEVPLSDGGEMRGSAGTNDLVSDGCQCVTAVGGADWNGDDDARRTLCPDCSNCSFHCRASRQAIVHQQDDAIVELERGPAIAIRVLSTRELGLFFTRDVIVGYTP